MKMATVLLATGLLIGLVAPTNAQRPKESQQDITKAERRILREVRRLSDEKQSTKSKKQAKQRGGDYRVEMVALGNGRWEAIRYRASTGESAHMVEGAWVALQEPESAGPRKGAYVVHALQTHAGRFAAVRLNTQTGQSWHLQDDRWLPIAGP